MRLVDLEITHHFLNVNGIRMHYVEKGTGPLVVLLHGFPENWWSWRYQIDELVRAGYRVVAPDQRGYNDTEARGPFDVDTLAEDIRCLIRALGAERATLVTHDWGGAVGWHVAATRPDVCERLVVLNCPHPAVMQRALLESRAQLKRSWYMFFFQLPWIPEHFLTQHGARAVARALRGNAVNSSHLSDEEIQPFLDGVLKPGRITAMLGWYRAAVRDGLRHLRSPQVYPTVRCPALVLWGMEDTALGFDDLVPGTERFAPRLEVKRIERAGHFVHQDRPEAVNAELLNWLCAPAARA